MYESSIASLYLNVHFFYVRIVLYMHDFKFLINTFFTTHEYISSSAFSK